MSLHAAATLTAQYNNLDSVREVFAANKGEIAGVICKLGWLLICHVINSIVSSYQIHILSINSSTGISCRQSPSAMSTASESPHCIHTEHTC